MKKAKKVLAVVIALVMMLSSFAFSASAVTHYELELNKSEYAFIEAYETVTYEFTPDKDGWYTFFSESYSGDDPYATLYDSEIEFIDYSDDFYDDEDNRDFRMITKLLAGETYLLEVGAYVEEGGACETYITVEEADVPVYAEVVSRPENAEVIEGFEAASAEVDSIEILYHYADGTTYLWSYEEYTDVNGLAVDCYTDLSEDGKYFYVCFECADTVVLVEYKVTDNPVESIEVTEMPNVQEYEFYYYPLWEGTEVEIILKDGTKIVKTLKEEDISCDVYYPEFSFDAEGYEVTINYYYDEDMNQECYIFNCLGREYCVNDLIFVDAEEVAELNATTMTETGEGAVVDVKFANGKNETFEFDVIDYYWDYYYDEVTEEYLEYISGVTLTKYGYTYYTLTPVHNEAGYLLGYELWFLGGTAVIDADKIEQPENNLYIMGDADCNSEVNIKDATAIQKHVAGIITLSEVGELLADVDGSGSVNVKDATAIQKWIAGIETGLPIGDAVN